MGAAKRLDGNYPDKQYLDKGEREGWVTVQEISMKRIIVDPAYQARDIPTKSPIGISVNMNHVKELAAIRNLNNGEFLAPIVVFLAPDGRFLLADGFHRHEENRQRRDKSIRAFVVKSNDHEHEARIFAAMCNQRLCLPRTKADEKKAAEILFSDPICLEWSDQKLADQCGVTSVTIRRWKLEYTKQRNIKIPDKFITANGVKRNRRRLADGRPSIFKTCDRYQTKYKGRTVNLGIDQETAEKRVTKIMETNRKQKLQLSNVNINRFFNIRGLILTAITIRCGHFGVLSANKTSSCLLVGLDSQHASKFAEAIGTLRLARLRAGMSDACMVIVCYVEDIPSHLIELARQDGIEFFTPEGLVANLKGTEPQEEKEPEGDLPCT
jgi:hypothetical protein